MTALETAIAEVTARIVEIVPAHEGLRDYARLDVQPPTKAEIDSSLADYDRMLALMQAFVVAGTALLDAHYPNLEPRLISKEALDDLQAQLNTITAARSQFVQVEAASGEITFGPVHE